MALKPKSFKSSFSTDSRLQSSLESAKWIAGLGFRKAVFWSECFYNSCPKGVFTLDIQATCSFTVYLVDEFGNVQTIGSGSGWTAYTFSFYAKCGKYRLKIVLDCPCGCAHVCYNLYQDQRDCFNCPNGLTQTYNPLTCSCECASSCQDCKKPQIWYKYPECTCACPTSKICKDG